jgi:hypothetical protein
MNTTSTTEFWVKRDVHNDIQKNSMTALPKDDLPFGFLPCAVPFHGYAAFGGEDMFRNKIIEMSLRMPE